MNTGFAKPQFAEVVEREGATRWSTTSSSAEILGDVPDDVPRYLAWVDDDDNRHETLEDLIESAVHGRPAASRRRSAGSCCSRAARPAHRRARRGRSARRSRPRSSSTACRWASTSGRSSARRCSTAPDSRSSCSPSRSARRPCTRRKFDPRKTLRDARGVQVRDARRSCPTMLQRMLNLDDDEIKKYDTSSLKIIFLAGSALRARGRQPRDGPVRRRRLQPVRLDRGRRRERRDPGGLEDGARHGRSVPVGCKVHIYDDDGKRITEPDVTGRIFVGSGLKFEGYTGGGIEGRDRRAAVLRRCRPLRRGRPAVHRRPRRRHDRLGRRERLPGRGREPADRAPGRRRRGGYRRQGRGLRRAAEGLRRGQGRAAAVRGRRQGAREVRSSPGTRCRARSSSSTSCRATRPGSCCARN